MTSVVADGSRVVVWPWAQEAKRTSAWLREAHGVLRRVDRLIVDIGDDPVGQHVVAIRPEVRGRPRHAGASGATAAASGARCPRAGRLLTGTRGLGPRSW